MEVPSGEILGLRFLSDPGELGRVRHPTSPPEPLLLPHADADVLRSARSPDATPRPNGSALCTPLDRVPAPIRPSRGLARRSNRRDQRKRPSSCRSLLRSRGRGGVSTRRHVAVPLPRGRRRVALGRPAVSGQTDRLAVRNLLPTPHARIYSAWR